MSLEADNLVKLHEHDDSDEVHEGGVKLEAGGGGAAGDTNESGSISKEHDEVLKPAHLHGIHRLGLTDHAQVVLLGALHLLLALLAHGPRQPLPGRATGQGGHCSPAHRLVFFPMFSQAVFQQFADQILGKEKNNRLLYIYC